MLVPVVIVKVGGSLFDHQALGPGLRQWLSQQPVAKHLFIPGGGVLADVIRDYHRIHRVSQELCHWLAIRAMRINAGMLASLLPDAREIHDPDQWPSSMSLAILNSIRFAHDDETRPGALPHDWRVTSDAMAARVAEVAKAPLIMLKSVDLPDDISWAEAAEQGLVDPMFGEVVRRSGIDIDWINFRRYLDGFR